MNDGGPAFPMSGVPDVDFDRGMSLRDWFAGQALMGEVANSSESCWRSDQSKALAELCYVRAEAMLAERAKRAE